MPRGNNHTGKLTVIIACSLDISNCDTENDGKFHRTSIRKRGADHSQEYIVLDRAKKQVVKKTNREIKMQS